jgi:hypothetical protein
METLMRHFILTLFVSASVISGGFVNVTSLKDNQILFREKGYVINKATFVHVRFTVNMTEYMDGVDEVLEGLNKTYYEEKRLAQETVNPFVAVGDAKMTSVWNEGEFEGLYKRRASDGMLVTLWLMDMLQSSVDDLKEILSVTPEAEEGDLQHKRTKRGILGGIALGLGLRNAYQIHVMEQYLAKLTSSYNQVVDSTSLLSDNHVQLAVDTTILKNFMKIMSTRNYHKIITYVLASNENMKKLYHTVKEIIKDGRLKRLSPSLIHGTELKILFTKLSIMAYERGCKMILENPSDLYKIETTYAYEKEGRVFAIYLHVPMVEKDEKLKLYEYVKYPIVQSLSANATIIPDVGEHTNIAVVPIAQDARAIDKISHHRFRTMSDTDLQACMKINDVYMCAGRNTLQTDIENSCIGGLWLADHTVISKNCDMKIGPLREYVAKLGSSMWIIFSPERRTTSVQCSNGLVESVPIEGQVRLEMPEDCMINLHSYYLTTDTNVNIEFKYKVIEWKFNGNVFEEFITGDENVNEIIRGIVQSKSKFGIGDISHLKQYYAPSSAQIAAIWDYLSGLNIFAWFGNIYIFLSACLLIVFIWFCYRGGCLSALYNCMCVRRPDDDDRNRHRNRANRVEDGESEEVQILRPIIMPPPRPSAPVVDAENAVGIENEKRVRKGKRVSDEGELEDECDPGPIPEGLRIEDFVCNHHVKKGAPGHCTGYFAD